MPPYFKPLRRKIGVVTLVMACVFLGLWVRSSRTCDMVAYGEGQMEMSLYSIRGVVALQLRDYDLRPPFLRWRSQAATKVEPLFIISTDEIEWLCKGLGFGIGGPPGEGPQVDFCVIPYWSIVIPLTPLSAWLLLSKPRVAKPTAKPVA